MVSGDLAGDESMYGMNMAPSQDWWVNLEAAKASTKTKSEENREGSTMGPATTEMPGEKKNEKDTSAEYH